MITTPFRIALGGEVLRGMDFAAQCAHAAALGYDCIELAPFTLSDAPHALAPAAALRPMLDTSAAGLTEAESPAALLDRWLPTGLIAHLRGDDRDRRGPGRGGDRFGPVLRALWRGGYDGWMGMEPFDLRGLEGARA